MNKAYDAASRRTHVTVTPTGTGQTTVNHFFTWDTGNRLTGITQGGTGSVGLNYDNANRRTCLTLPNGLVVNYGYDVDSRVTSMAYGVAANCSTTPTNVSYLTYVYDADGRRIAMSGSQGGGDPAGRSQRPQQHHLQCR